MAMTVVNLGATETFVEHLICNACRTTLIIVMHAHMFGNLDH